MAIAVCAAGSLRTQWSVAASTVIRIGEHVHANVAAPGESPVANKATVPQLADGCRIGRSAADVAAPSTMLSALLEIGFTTIGVVEIAIAPPRGTRPERTSCVRTRCNGIYKGADLTTRAAIARIG